MDRERLLMSTAGLNKTAFHAAAAILPLLFLVLCASAEPPNTPADNPFAGFDLDTMDVVGDPIPDDVYKWLEVADIHVWDSEVDGLHTYPKATLFVEINTVRLEYHLNRSTGIYAHGRNYHNPFYHWSTRRRSYLLAVRVYARQDLKTDGTLADTLLWEHEGYLDPFNQPDYEYQRDHFFSLTMQEFYRLYTERDSE